MLVVPGLICTNMPLVLKNNLKQHRRNRGLTQAELGQRMGVCRQTIIAIEQGNRAPSVTLALHLADELSAKMEELFWLAAAKKPGRSPVDRQR